MSLLAELKRRNVFRMGGAYLALGWVVTQVTATVAPALGMPEWTLKLVVWLGIIGFPLIVAFAWAYELTPEGIRRESELPPSIDIRHASGRRLDYITIGMIAVALLFFVAQRLLAPARESAQPATVDAKSGAAHARSIAVLPFINLSGDSAQAYFTDGITEDLITDLARLPGLMVIARNSSFAYKGKQVRPQQIAQELGIRYLLEGSVQRQGDRLRINAQLIDAVGGQHLWAERYSGTLEDVFALQDKVIGQIVAALQLKLPDTTGRSETSNPAAYDALLKGLERLRQGSATETTAAIEAFERAVALDPDYARAHAALAAAHWQVVSSLWDLASGTGYDRAYEGMRKHLALAMRAPTPLAHAVNAELAIKEGRNSEALAEIDEALKSAPSDPDVRVIRARILNALGRAADAEAEVRHAMRLEPGFSPAYQSELARAQFNQQKYEDALATITEVVNRRSDVFDYATMIASLGQLGHTAGVREAIAKYNEINVAAGMDPLTVQEYNWWWYGDIFTYDDDYRARLVQGLRKAGVPEGAGAELRLADYKQLISRRGGEYTIKGVTEIDLETTQAMLEAGAISVDVRPATDFERNGHIPGSVSLSLPAALSSDSLGEVARPDGAVIFSCHGKYCPYSAYAAAKAVLWGYTRVYRFAGGFPTWQAAGRPVAVGPSNQTADPEVASR